MFIATNSISLGGWGTVSLKQPIFLRFEPKKTETQSVSVVFQFISRNPKKFVGFVSDRYRNNQNKQNFFKTNRNKPKKSQKKRSLLGWALDNFFSVRTKTN
jgi:hypothetical protein